MTIAVLGIGWLTNRGYGCIRSGLQSDYETGEGAHTLPKRDIFSHPFRNFGRLDGVSKMTAYAVSLALQDAGMEYSPDRKQDIGIIGTNTEGSLRSDVEYFRDYLAGGRTLSRGNLFIYTLPSSPLGEAAIHFGLLGPLLYAASEKGGMTEILDLANEMLLARETPVLLAGRAETDEALFFVLKRDPDEERSTLCSVSEALSLLAQETEPGVAGLVRKLTQLAVRKGTLEN
jgi:3-oxoacyl-[acyl-carrier-protein] synthase II